ncbi:MAG: pilus assembly protein [Alphaproteobacteria bacterium]|nr:pilus assembly protein [Alphaproteobacteria bacterium]
MYWVRKFLHKQAGRTADKTAVLLRDREGAGAVEFAFVAPLLVLIYMGAVEISVALSVDTKVSRAGNITLDLITQGTSITKSEMKDLVDVAAGIMAPFDASDIELKFTGITVDGSKNAKIDWSWGSKTTKPYTKGAVVDIPSGLKIANSYYIRSEIVNTHQFLTSYPFMGSASASIDMNETYYMRPRLGTDLDCTDC